VGTAVVRCRNITLGGVNRFCALLDLKSPRCTEPEQLRRDREIFEVY